MIPKGGAAFLTPFFGNWAGKDDMTKYFLKDTPLAGLERQMMTPPNSIPRGGGQMVLCQFRYRPEDVDCKICTEYRKRHCASQVCPWLEERAEAGVVTYSALASVFYERWMDGMLGKRLRKVLSGKESVAYYDDGHVDRLQVCSTYLVSCRKSGAWNHRLAALYLLTATEILRRWAMPNLFGFWPTALEEWKELHDLSGQEYALYQTARGIYRRQRTITIPELCDEDLVDDLTLALILDALLINHYGPVVLRLGGTRGEEDEKSKRIYSKTPICFEARFP